MDLKFLICLDDWRRDWLCEADSAEAEAARRRARMAALAAYIETADPQERRALTDLILEAYRPLVTDVGAHYVSIQVASLDPNAAIQLVGRDVIPRLRAL